MNINANTNAKKEVNQDKLYWTVKHKNDFASEEDFLTTILMDCGIKYNDIPKFLNPNRSMIHDPFLMKNMEEAVELLHKHIQNRSQIAILPDNDNDGLCSASVLGQFLQKDLVQELPEIIYVFSEGKSHGLEYDLVKNFKQGDIDLFIIPDASLTMENAKLIQKNFPNMDILVIDHHLVSDEYHDKETGKWITEKEASEIKNEDPDRIEIDRYTNHVVSVNDTDGQYPNPTLSGGGVVLKVIEAFKERYPDECNDDCLYKYLDLVSLAIMGDGMDLRELETRYYVIEGMKHAFRNNLFFNELQNRLKDEMSFDRYIGSAQWVLIPKVNGVVRFGKKGKKGELSEKEQLFYAILGKEGTVQYKPRRKSKNDPEPELEEHTLAWDAARMAVNVKSRQDTEVRKYFKILQERIETQHLDENSVIFVDGTEVVERGETGGLIANKLASNYHRPIVLMREFDSETYGGSGRGYNKSNIKDLNELLTSVGVTCMGHSNAHGVRFKKKDLQSVIQKCNELYPLDSLQVIHEVDWEIPAKKLKKEYVSEVATNYEIWGNTVPEPVFVITDLVISASDINAYGETKNFIRFVYNGVVFIKKYCSFDDYDKMICKQRTSIGKPKYNVRLNLICQFVLNAWEDKVNPEVKILYFDSVRDDKISLEDEWLNDNNNNKVFNNVDISGTISSLSVAGDMDDNVVVGDDNKNDKMEVEEPAKKKCGRPRKTPIIINKDEEIKKNVKNDAKITANNVDEDTKIREKNVSKKIDEISAIKKLSNLKKDEGKYLCEMYSVNDDNELSEIDEMVDGDRPIEIQKESGEKFSKVVDKPKKKIYTLKDDFAF